MSILLAFNFDCSWPLILAALGAAILGWLLHQFLKGGGNADLQAKYDRLSQDFHEERERYNKLHNQFKKKGNASANLGASANAAGTDEVKRLQGKIEKLKTDLKFAEDAKSSLQQELNLAANKTKESNALHSEIEGLKARIDSLNKALDEARQNADKYKADYESANGERARLSQEFANSNAGSLKKTIEKLEADLNSSRFTASQLQLELDKLKNGERKIFAEGEIKEVDHSTTIKELEEQIKTLKSENQNIRFENERWAKEIANKNLEMVAVRNDAMMKSNEEIIEMRNRLRLAELDMQRLKEAAQKQAEILMNTTTSNKSAETKNSAPVAEYSAAQKEETNAAPENTSAIDAKLAEIEQAKSNPDDLKVLEGVGPVLAQILNDANIYTYAQLADHSAESLKDILVKAGDNMHNPGSWPRQAALLRDGKMEEFKAFCDELNAGRL